MKNVQRYPVPAPHVRPLPVGPLRRETPIDIPSSTAQMLDLLTESTSPPAGHAHVVAIATGILYLAGIGLLLAVMRRLNEWWG